MSKHLVLVGGGHAHMTVMLNLADYTKRGHRVTLISPSSYHYYSGMGPGLLAGIYQPQEVRFHIKKMVEARGAEFKEGEVERIDPQNRILYLADGESVGYDVASFNTGIAVPMKGIISSGDTVIPVKPIANLYNAALSISRMAAVGHLNIIIVGGGPAGVEISANVWRLIRNGHAKANISLVAGGKILSGFPERARRLVIKSLAAKSIYVIEGVRAKSLANQEAILSDGRT
ncbi:MAG: FAD-dependent oxidoreductase, partial [Desulforhabdus sp.]|nr:FAD-dependent oxidoreductase [Desulforhabdus sp.]